MMLRLITLALLLALQHGAFAQSQKPDPIKVLNRVSDELMRGNIDALADVKALPGDDALGGLLMFFMQNYNLHKATPLHKSIAARSAQYISELPQSEAFIRGMFKKKEGRKPSPILAQYRQAGLNCLTALKNEWALKVIFDLIDEPDLDVPLKDFSFALSKMGLSGAPYSPGDRTAGAPGAIARWQLWWIENSEVRR